jgi:hypothetical protein
MREPSRSGLLHDSVSRPCACDIFARQVGGETWVTELQDEHRSAGVVRAADRLVHRRDRLGAVPDSPLPAQHVAEYGDHGGRLLVGRASR